MEAVVAIDSKGGIAKNGVIPWKCKEDMQFFREKTEGHVVVMGKTTFFTLPKGPLPNRLNIVFTKTPELYGHLSRPNLVFSNNPDILQRPFSHPLLKENYTVFIIGGSQIYDLFLPKCKTLWISQIPGDYHCDTHFTPPSSSSLDIDTTNGLTFDIQGQRIHPSKEDGWTKESFLETPRLTIHKYQRQV
jgi:dihydrofolate reductase